MTSVLVERRTLEIPTSFSRGRGRGRGRVDRLSFVEGPVTPDGRYVRTGRVLWRIPS